MHIDTKYNIGDNIIILNYYGFIIYGTVESLQTKLDTEGNPIISYHIRFDDNDIDWADEDFVYANIQEIIEKEKEREKDEIRLEMERHDEKLHEIEERHTIRYNYLNEQLNSCTQLSNI